MFLLLFGDKYVMNNVIIRFLLKFREIPLEKTWILEDLPIISTLKFLTPFSGHKYLIFYFIEVKSFVLAFFFETEDYLIVLLLIKW